MGLALRTGCFKSLFLRLRTKFAIFRLHMNSQKVNPTIPLLSILVRASIHWALEYFYLLLLLLQLITMMKRIMKFENSVLQKSLRTVLTLIGKCALMLR
jgi:hypothetical protein